MRPFESVSNKINEWFGLTTGPLKITGISASQWNYLISLCANDELPYILNNDHLVVCPNCEVMEELFRQSMESKVLSQHFNIYFLPGHEVSPYSSSIASEKELLERFYALSHLSIKEFPNKRNLVYCTSESLNFQLPPTTFFNDHSFELQVGDVISHDDLMKRLHKLGYAHTVTTEEPGTFSRRGEIFDIWSPSIGPRRIHFFDELVEEIYSIDSDTQKTIKDFKHDKILLTPAPQILCRESEFVSNLRANLPMPSPQFKEKYEKRRLLFEKFQSGGLFENWPFYLPLFFSKTATLLDYFNKDATLIHFVDFSSGQRTLIEFFEELNQDYEITQEDKNSECLLPDPSKLYFNKIDDLTSNWKKVLIEQIDVSLDLNPELKNLINLNLEASKAFLTRHLGPTTDRHNFIKKAISFISDEFDESGHIFFTYKTQQSKDELVFLIESDEKLKILKTKIKFLNITLDQGFYYPLENILVLSESDLFAYKKSAAKVSRKKVDLFAEQIATLKKGDFVVHNTYGIGKYEGLQSIEAGGTKSDFLVLLYEGNDKVYVPVYKMNLIQKFADESAEVKLANLNSNKFDHLKARAKSSAKKLAFDLLKLQAQRESSEAYAFSAPDHIYKEFELAFPFEETPDQINAINDVIEDMQKNRPMDRLVCGDVGFGKTEVAMRAAFKAVLDKKQVAVLVPTTILALQHYNTFQKRFKDFPVNIDFLSRFKTATQSKEVLAKLKEGSLDIIIGTHKLLSKEVDFHDLGLVIVDEEQRFGVNHKERLKSLKSSVDFLTLTATPIPRTLQLAFLGIRDLSIIQTAPPKRQSIKTYIIKNDPHTIQSAIDKEIARGGQVFFVHNRVMDIEKTATDIKKLVPKAKVIIGHGQLNERELEKRIKSFYDQEYQVLVATTIIESGLDIPTANTMIIDRADTYGLSQLHQLRGRIGRSDRKAYAYFVVPRDRQLSEVATKRLQALQTYADMGSGFSIASSDLEIRGAGDILGAEQSGHIEAIGLELYMELLQEAIAEIKNEQYVAPKDIEIQTSEPASIPSNFISSPGVRLKYYKKLSNCRNLNELYSLKDEFEDIFGSIPHELSNLLKLLEARIYLQNCGLASVKLSGAQIHLKFDKEVLEKREELRNKIISTFMSRPKVYQITPDYSVIYRHKEQLGLQQLVDFSKDIAQQLVPC